MLSITTAFTQAASNHTPLINNQFIQHLNQNVSQANLSQYSQYAAHDSPFGNASFRNASYEMATNDSFTEYAEIPYYIKATSMTFCIVIMCLGVIGNVMVPIVILKTKDMRNSTNIFLVNLSIADLMVLLVCTPTVLVEVNSKPETWVLGKELCLAVPFVELTVAHASVLTILAISFERYYAICEPLRAGYVCTKTRAALICACAWLFAALFTSPILAIAEHRTEDREDGTHYATCLTQAVTFWQIFFFVMVIILLYILPLIILIILYSVIAKNLISAASKVVMNKTIDPSNVRARKQVILMLGTVVLCFFICLMPYRVLALWIIISPSELTEDINPEKWYNLLYFSRIMLYINSAVNPILYNLMSSKFRLGFCKVCICYRDSLNGVRNLRPNRNRADTMTNGSTTSSSLSRTTTSLKKLFHRSSLDRSNTTKSDNTDAEFREANIGESNNVKSSIFIKVKKRFVRQQSAPVCSNSNITSRVNRMRSEGNMFEVSAFVDHKTNADSDGVTQKFLRHSDAVSQNKPEVEVDMQNRTPYGSLRRSVLINSTKAKSVEGDSKNCISYQKINLDCVIGFKSKGVDYDFPESFV